MAEIEKTQAEIDAENRAYAARQAEALKPAPVVADDEPEALRKYESHPVIADPLGKPVNASVRAELDRQETEREQSHANWNDVKMPEPAPAPGSGDRPPVRTNQPVTPTVHAPLSAPDDVMREKSPVPNGEVAKLNGLVQERDAIEARMSSVVSKDHSTKESADAAGAQLKRDRAELNVKLAEIDQYYATLVGKYGEVSAQYAMSLVNGSAKGEPATLKSDGDLAREAKHRHDTMMKEYTDLRTLRMKEASESDVTLEQYLQLERNHGAALAAMPKVKAVYVYAKDECRPVTAAKGSVCPTCGWTSGGNSKRDLQPHPVVA